MTIAHFLVYSGPNDRADGFAAWFGEAVTPTLLGFTGIETLDIYTPAKEKSEDPYLDDGEGPILTAQTGFADLASVEAALASDAFETAIGDPARFPFDGCGLTHDVLEVKFFPVAGETAPAPLMAPFSYVVRYHRPADDERGFVEHYCAKHPPILGKFPKIRNVLCYAPVDWTDPTGIAQADYLLGNEVVFDNIRDLNDAMRTDIRHELPDDYKTFPPCLGHNTHFPMDRARLWP